MKHHVLLIASFLCACTVLPAIEGCSSGYEVAALAPSKPFRIDGKADDWAGHLLYYRDANLTVGVSNDARFLYLCVTSSDQSVYRSILIRGLTVWIDTTAGKGKYFGLRFPLDMNRAEMLRDEEQPASIDEMLKRRAEEATKLAVVGGGKDEQTEMLLPGRDGMDARVGYQSGVFAYEMKIPLGVEIADGRRVSFADGDRLSLRLETPEFEHTRMPMRDRSQPGMAGGGMGENQPGEDGFGGRGRGRGARGGAGMPTEGRPPTMESIDFLLKVEKAK